MFEQIRTNTNKYAFVQGLSCEICTTLYISDTIEKNAKKYGRTSSNENTDGPNKYRKVQIAFSLTCLVATIILVLKNTCSTITL